MVFMYAIPANLDSLVFSDELVQCFAIWILSLSDLRLHPISNGHMFLNVSHI
jgi:hypothetical protein